MANKVKTNTKGRTTVSRNPAQSIADIEDKYAKYYWIIIPLLTILYYSYRNVAVGFYQDDEVAQYLNMLNFWNDPWVILGNGPKPGYKIFIAPFSLISYDAVLIGNSLIAACTVYLTYYLIKLYRIPYAIIGALLLAAQPMYVGLSFRSYSEIFTALLIVSFLIFYKKENYILSSLLLGYIYTVRQEIALLIAVLSVYYIIKKKYNAAALLFVFPVLYNLLGFIKTGDPWFILTEMQSVAGLNYKSQGLFHYFKVYVYIVGPVCFSLFFAGFFGFFNNLGEYKKYIRKYGIFYLIFISIFIVQMLTMLNDGPNPGNWRYLLHISPICVFFAVVGLNNFIDPAYRKTTMILLGVSAFYVLIFSSKETDGFALLEKADYTILLFILALIGLLFLLRTKNLKDYLFRAGIAAVILGLIHIYFVENKKLSPELITVKTTSEFLAGISEVDNKVKLTNHPFVIFYSGVDRDNIKSYIKLDNKNLENTPENSILIWESHYGYRPEFLNDVKYESLLDSTKFKLLGQFVSTDQRFYSFIFEKL